MISRAIRAAVTLLLLFFCTAAFSESPSEGENLFKQKCTACHTLGKGKLVGPDLQGVVSRREEAWLKRQIKEPQALIAEGDPIATQLVQEMGGIPMAPLGLTDDEVDAILAYLKSIEQQSNVSTGLPPQYFLTILISVIVLIVITWLGLKVGKKKVNVE